jgi:hypothetical protein
MQDKSTLVEPKLYPKPAEYQLSLLSLFCFMGLLSKRCPPLAYASFYYLIRSSPWCQNRIHIAFRALK